MEIILGHLIGDYLLQNDWMALNKKKNSFIGYLSCYIHSFIWTISVCIFLDGFILHKFMLLLFSHYIIDKSNFVVWYLNTFKIMKNPPLWKIIIVDNTIHLIFIYIIFMI